MARTGFSHETFTSFTEPRISSSVDQCCEQIGQETVRLFLDMLAASCWSRRC